MRRQQFNQRVFSASQTVSFDVFFKALKLWKHAVKSKNIYISKMKQNYLHDFISREASFIIWLFVLLLNQH